MENEIVQFIQIPQEVMNVLLHVIQIFGILVPIIGIIIILQRVQSRASTYLMLANVCCAVMNCAYLMILEFTQFDALALAFKVKYVSISFFYFFFILFIWEYQYVKVPPAIVWLWPVYELVEIPQMWVKEYTTAGGGEKLNEDLQSVEKLFGSHAQKMMGDVQIQMDNMIGLYQVEMQGGALYQIRYGIIATALAVTLGYTLFRVFVTNNKTEKHNLLKLIGAQIVISAALAVTFIWDIPYDIVPITSALVVCVMSLSVLAGEIFTVTDEGREWVLEHIDEVFLIADADYGYLDANHYAREVFPQLRHIRKNQILPGEILQLFLTAGDEVQIKERYYERKVSTLYQRERHKPKVAGHSLIMVDVTKQHQLVEAAEAANESKSAFLSNMSHEIRTPMNAIVGMTEMMLRSEVDPEQQMYLNNIKNSGDALLGIINDILDFSKIESGRMELVEDVYEPMSLLSDLGMMFLTRLGEKKVELLFHIDPALPKKLIGDGLRVRQIMINFLNNAVKFTEEGSVTLELRVVKRQEGRVKLYVSVRDTGQGIKEEDLGKLFQSFSQVDSKKNHSKEGTGLGLAISKQMVEMMGGEIGVESVYGEGSDFHFTAWQKVEDGEPAAQIPESFAAVRAEDGEKRPLRIAYLFSSQTLENAFAQLAEDYGFAAERGMDTGADFFFTDSGLFSSEAEALLDKAGSQVCVLQNPMQETLHDERVTVINKPLYSLNFCQAIKRETQAGFRASADGISFSAPEAKILIVDDNQMNLKVAVGLLDPFHMQIDTAQDGKQAVALVQKKDYDLVFMDHMMPVMDGIEATQHIRALGGKYADSLPIVALTADAMSGAKAEFVAAGMNDFVAKPIEMKEIASKLYQYLPKEKIVRAQSDPAQSGTAQGEKKPAGSEKETKALPQIDGLHVAEGVKACGDLNLYMELLGDYYKMINIKATKIEKCLADNMLRDYTIEVHALKTTSRMIGALELSEQFRELEALGDKEDKKTLDEKTPAVLEYYRSYKEILRPYGAVDIDTLKEADDETLVGLLNRIADAMDAFDLDGVDEAMAELETYRLPESCMSDMDDLRAMVADVAMEDVMKICRRMAGRLGGQQ